MSIICDVMFLIPSGRILISVIAVGRKYGAVTKVKKVTGKCYCPETPCRLLISLRTIHRWVRLDIFIGLLISTS